jgi:hypothetical protein
LDEIAKPMIIAPLRETSSSSGTIVDHSPTRLNSLMTDAGVRYGDDNSRKKVHNVDGHSWVNSRER